jgi:hypothetical protein
MIIILSFLSGELRELEISNDTTCVYHVKSILSDDLYNEGIEKEPDLIRLYDNTRELDRLDTVMDQNVYRVVIDDYLHYLIFLQDDEENNTQTLYLKNIDTSEEKSLSDKDISKLSMERTLYSIDLESFIKSWFSPVSDLFFNRHSYDLRDDNVISLYLSEEEFGSDNDENWEENDQRVLDRTKECLHYIFGIFINFNYK